MGVLGSHEPAGKLPLILRADEKETAYAELHGLRPG
jgi:hypothetical protein